MFFDDFEEKNSLTLRFLAKTKKFEEALTRLGGVCKLEEEGDEKKSEE